MDHIQINKLESTSHLKWGRQSNILFGAFASYRKMKRLTDTTLVCKGKFYHVHKLLLSASCSYFDKIFNETNYTDPVIILNDIGSEELESLLELIYEGQVSIPNTSLSKLLEIANCLQFKGLGKNKDGKTFGLEDIEYDSDTDELETESYELNLEEDLNESKSCVYSSLDSQVDQHYIHEIPCEEYVAEEVIDDHRNIKVEDIGLSEDSKTPQSTCQARKRQRMTKDNSVISSEMQTDPDLSSLDENPPSKLSYQPRKRRKNRSVVYKFFTKGSTKSSMACILCCAVLRTSDGSTSMLRHLKSFHHGHYQREIKKKNRTNLEETKKLTVYKFFMETNFENKVVCKMCDDVILWKTSPHGLVKHLKRKHPECWDIRNGKLNVCVDKLSKQEQQNMSSLQRIAQPNTGLKKKPSSLVWTVFANCNQPNYRQCLLCGEKVHFKNSSSTLLLTHLEINHLEILLNENTLTNLKDIDNKSGIVCSLPASGLSKRSPVWKFFYDDSDGKTLLCKFCGSPIAKSRSTTSLIRHVRKKHPEVCSFDALSESEDNIDLQGKKARLAFKPNIKLLED